MAITDSIVRLGASLIETLHTRLELASVEIEEEFGRYASYFVLSLLGLFCCIVTILLIILLVLIVFWDTHRELALVGLIALFGIATLVIMFYLRNAIKNKPRLLAASLKELQNDLQILRQFTDHANSPAQASAKNNSLERDNEGF
ncbi:phage holin family protein [Undibacterium sp. Di24W]|uniref:phage holin family protein n=1 Tax=Undibacterium sp. Di24W TaxID=3413033 RepID=UPI003BF22A59